MFYGVFVSQRLILISILYNLQLFCLLRKLMPVIVASGNFDGVGSVWVVLWIWRTVNSSLLPSLFSFYSIIIIRCPYRFKVILIRLLNVGRRLLLMRSVSHSAVSRLAKNSDCLGWGLARDNKPALYFDAASMLDSLLVTLLQSRAWRPLSVLTSTRLVPLSSSISGISLLMPQKSAIVISLWLRPCLAWQLWQLGRRIRLDRKARI